MKTETFPLSETCTLVVPPNIQVMMTGVQTAKIFPSGIVQLQYTDGNSESAHLTMEQLAAGRVNFFSLVSAVQAMRGPKLFCQVCSYIEDFREGDIPVASCENCEKEIKV